MKPVIRLFTVGVTALGIGTACHAQAVDGLLRAGEMGKAAEQLARMNPASAERGQAIEDVLGQVPLHTFTPATAQAWANCLEAIQTETNPYWGNKNLGDLLGALAAPGAPPAGPRQQILVQLGPLASRWQAQGAQLTLAQGLLWLGEFPRALGLYPTESTPPAVTEFAFEVLADKPQLAAQDPLWQLALARVGEDAEVTERAIHALGFCGRADQAIALAQHDPDTLHQAQLAVQAARYARYGGHGADFVRLMNVAANTLCGHPHGMEAVPVWRQLLAETSAPPLVHLPDDFWNLLEQTAAQSKGPAAGAIATEVAGAAAWSGRKEAGTVADAIVDPTWKDAALMRVACGLLWNHHHDQANSCLRQIVDPEWKSAAVAEMGYLAAQTLGPTVGDATAAGDPARPDDQKPVMAP